MISPLLSGIKIFRAFISSFGLASPKEYEMFGMYIQGVTIGLITFSIPFLWNVYQRILDIKKHATGNKIYNYIAREIYKKEENNFYRYLLLPIGSIFISGLTLFPLLNGVIALTLLLFSFVYILCMPRIYIWIEERCNTDLKKLLSELKDYEKLLRAFSELWQMKDEEIKREYSTDMRDIYQIFSRRIDRMIIEGQEGIIDLSLINKSLESFMDNMNHRDMYVFFVSKDTFPRILQWSYETWRSYKPHSNSEKGSWLYSRNILYELIDDLMGRALKGPFANIYFDEYEKHVGKIDGKDAEYLSDIISRFCDIFFVNIDDAEQKHLIWRSYYPVNWQITENNLKDTSNKVVKIITDKYIRWTFDRIINSKGGYDAQLDEVSRNLLPETDPIDWAKLLIFTLILFSSNNNYDSAVKQPISFGMSGRIMPGIIDMEKLKGGLERQHKITLSLLKTIFPERYSDSNLKHIVSNLKALKYEENTKEESKKKWLLKVFTNNGWDEAREQ